METNLNRITAVLGPTNTGKTHHAEETMLEYKTGIIGFPLRLLAREIYDKCVIKLGKEKVALITGEEKIIPKSPRYFVCTVESMPQDMIVDFVAVDEVASAVSWISLSEIHGCSQLPPATRMSCWPTCVIVVHSGKLTCEGVSNERISSSPPRNSPGSEGRHRHCTWR